MGSVYLDFSKALNTVSRNIVIGKFMKCGLDEGTKRWVENWMNDRAERAVISGVEFTWRPVASRIPQESKQGAVFYNNDLGEGTECTSLLTLTVLWFCNTGVFWQLKKQLRRKIMLNIVHNIMNLSDPFLKSLIQDGVRDIHAGRMWFWFLLVVKPELDKRAVDYYKSDNNQ